MPTYDYKCLDCNFTFEEFQKMTDEPLESCPSCQGSLKRLIGTGVTPIFKGSGFYQTDYKDKKASKKSTSSVPSTPKKDASKVSESKVKNDS